MNISFCSQIVSDPKTTITAREIQSMGSGFLPRAKTMAI